MFYYFNGEVTLLESNLAVIDCGGVGYACRTSSYTLSRLHVGERARLYTYCSIREDAFDIYGFSTREELRNFELLLGVTGVGAKAALAILSSTTPDRFALAIFSQDEKALTAARRQKAGPAHPAGAEGQARWRRTGRGRHFAPGRGCARRLRQRAGAGAGRTGRARLPPAGDHGGAAQR